MAYQNKTKNRASREEPALQLTSYQLVMATCSLLLAGCLLFVAGIMVNRYTGIPDRPMVSQLEETAPAAGPPASPQPTASDRKTEGVQVAPKPVTLPPEPGAGTQTQGTTKPPVVRDTGSKYIPAPPPRRSTTPGAAPAPIGAPAADSAPKPDAAQPAVPQPPVEPVVTPVVTQPAASGSATEQAIAVPDAPVAPDLGAVAPAGSGESPAPETAPTATPVAQPITPSAAPQAPFTIQVASFDAENLERAKKFKKAVEDKTDYTVDLVPSKDGKWVRAFVGSYPDRAAADKARTALSKIKDFEGCFVKSLAE